MKLVRGTHRERAASLTFYPWALKALSIHCARLQVPLGARLGSFIGVGAPRTGVSMVWSGSHRFRGNRCGRMQQGHCHRCEYNKQLLFQRGVGGARIAICMGHNGRLASCKRLPRMHPSVHGAKGRVTPGRNLVVGRGSRHVGRRAGVGGMSAPIRCTPSTRPVHSVAERKRVRTPRQSSAHRPILSPT